MSEKITIFWFRQDLRVSDNPGLFHAAQHKHVMPIYIMDNESRTMPTMGTTTHWWLHQSLESLNKNLDYSLNIYSGPYQSVILKLITTYNIEAFYWNRCYEPWHTHIDKEILALLHTHGIPHEIFNASLFWEPTTIHKKDGSPYKVYTSFYKSCLQTPPPRPPLPAPSLVLFNDQHNHQTIQDLPLTIQNRQPMHTRWQIGEQAAQVALTTFINKHLKGYKKNRDYPGLYGTSYLSPHLHFGEISPNQIWHTIHQKNIYTSSPDDAEHFIKELLWREFSYYTLYHFPALPYKNFQEKFDQFTWEDNPSLLQAWQQGKTGYPFVDAGMRELLQTGYMHNRVRMVVSSFLVKNLFIHWHHGAAWFWDQLVDADLANNSMNWQWVAGSGLDAAPYFRIFNPTLQGEKFDKNGEYTRRFVPELAKLPNKYLFKPWIAPTTILAEANIVLGTTYPKPIINFQQSRQKALSAYKKLAQNSNSY